jgi:serine/threonine protein kinase
LSFGFAIFRYPVSRNSSPDEPAVHLVPRGAARRYQDHSARLEQEARAVAALNHPHICQIYDVGPDYLVLEYVDGAPLSGPLAQEEALRIAIQIAGALEAAHAKGILHRDPKPGTNAPCCSARPESRFVEAFGRDSPQSE